MTTKNSWLTTFVLCLLWASASIAQEHATGVFATIKIEKSHKTKDYGRRVFNRSHREKFLIPEIPLIASAEFVAISTIENDIREFHSYFSITVSSDGLLKLRNVVKNLRDTELVLLIENTVFGRISSKSEDDFRHSKITIVSPLKDADLEWAHQKLTEMIAARDK